MSKNILQLKDFFTMTSFCNEDYPLIYKWLKEHKLNIDPYDLSRTYHGSTTYKEFLNWYENGYGLGDYVKVNGYCEMVGPYDKDKILLQTYHYNDKISIVTDFYKEKDFSFYWLDFIDVDKNDVSNASAEEKSSLEKELISHYCHLNPSGFIEYWPKYVEKGAFVNVILFGRNCLGKIGSLNIETVSLSFLLVEGELQFINREYHEGEFTKAKSEDVKKAYKYCLEKFGFDIKRGEYLDSSEINKTLIKQDLPKRIEEHVREELEEKSYSIDISDVANEFSEKYGTTKQRIKNIILRFVRNDKSITLFDFEKTCMIINTKKIIYKQSDFVSFFSEICSLTHRDFFKYEWMEKFIASSFPECSSELKNSYTKNINSFSTYLKYKDSNNDCFEDDKYIGKKHLIGDQVFLVPNTDDEYLDLLNFLYEPPVMINDTIGYEIFYNAYNWILQVLSENKKLSVPLQSVFLKLIKKVLDSAKLSHWQRNTLSTTKDMIRFVIQNKRMPLAKKKSEKELARWYRHLNPPFNEYWLLVAICDSWIKVIFNEISQIEETMNFKVHSSNFFLKYLDDIYISISSEIEKSTSGIMDENDACISFDEIFPELPFVNNHYRRVMIYSCLYKNKSLKTKEIAEKTQLNVSVVEKELCYAKGMGHVKGFDDWYSLKIPSIYKNRRIES